MGKKCDIWPLGALVSKGSNIAKTNNKSLSAFDGVYVIPKMARGPRLQYGPRTPENYLTKLSPEKISQQ